MPDRRQIADSIVRRLIEASEEVASLEVARAALTRAAQPTSASSAHRSVARGALAKVARQPKAAPKGRSAPARKPDSPAVQPAPRPKVTDPVPAARRPRSRDLALGEIEAILRNSPDGLSASALVKQTGAGAAKVRDRLRDLERSGEARRSGTRRTSVWRLLSDEQRIAARVAELERASSTGEAVDDRRRFSYALSRRAFGTPLFAAVFVTR